MAYTYNVNTMANNKGTHVVGTRKYIKRYNAHNNTLIMMHTKLRGYRRMWNTLASSLSMTWMEEKKLLKK